MIIFFAIWSSSVQMPFKRSLKTWQHGSGAEPNVRPRLCHDVAPLREGPVLTQGCVTGGAASSRPDGAEPAPYTRGSAALAFQLAKEHPDRCRDELVHSAFAPTSKGPIASRRKLWDRVASTAGFQNTFLLTCELIFTVMGALKLAGYRSAELYLDAAKSRHISLGYPWSDQLQLAARHAIRSCRRGIGPARQAQGLPLLRLGEVCLEEPLVPGGPKWPGRSTILVSWWLLREIEAHHSLVSHISVDQDALKITWRLPSSKTDWRAIGAERAHRCACDFVSTKVCPFHCMLEHLKCLSSNRADCLFPGISGKPATKQGWADTFQEIARRLGLATRWPNGARAFTGHSARATGAMHMASAQIDLWRIQLFGRWGSEVFKQYVRDAPLSQLDHLAVESSAALSIQEAKGRLTDLLRRAQASRLHLEVPNTDCAPDCEAAGPSVADGSSQILIANSSPGGKVHKAAVFDLGFPPRAWRTRCNWRFGVTGADFTQIREAPARDKCRVCFPEVRHLARSNSDGSVSSSAYSSTSSHTTSTP